MAQITANGIAIEVEDHGKKSDPAILLVMGLSAQLVFWPEDFIQSLVEAGYRVIAFDNRDIGLSHKFEGLQAPGPVWQLLVKKFLPSRKMAPYSLEDMAADTVGVMDALDIDRAHVIGLSMGGMIGQILAAKHPGRVATFIPMMTSTNNPKLPRAERHVQKALFGMSQNRPKDIDAATAMAVEFFKLIGSPEGARAEGEVENLIRAAIKRSHYPAGPKRQLAAIIESGDLRDWTKRITAPTLVIHGDSDALVPSDCGRDIAANIEGAEFALIKGMGHDLPSNLLDEVTRLIVKHVSR